MPYTPTAWVNGTTPVNQTNMNHLETSYTESSLSFEPDQFTAGFILSGLVATKDGVTATQLDVTAGTAYILQADGTTRQRKLASFNETTATPSTTYYLDFNPDGTVSWGTSHSGQANYLPICQVTTDGSGNILAVTDKRTLSFTLFAGAALTPSLPYLSSDTGLVTTDGLGTLTITAPAAPSAPSAATASNTTTATYSATVLGDTPLRYYRMDAPSGTTETDHGSNAQNGTSHASPTLGVTGALDGDTDTAYTLASASSQYVSAAATGLPSGNAGWSIEAWVNFPSNPAGNQIIACFGTSSSGAQAELYIDSSGRPNVAVVGGTAVVGTALTTGAWHHIVGTYDGSNERLYVDGTLVAGPTAPGVTVNIGTTGLAIGAQVTAANYFNGSLDEVAVYSGALSQTKVTNHYTIGKNGPDSQTLPGVGTYHYTVTFATAASETAQSAQASVTTTTGNQKVSLTSIPTGPHGTTKRNIYRTALGGSTLDLLATLADNTTTSYTDQLPDSSLGGAQGAANAGSISVPGLSITGSVGGQAIAGSFGVPVIVAALLHQNVTNTSQHTTALLTISATGLYRISAYVMRQTGSTTAPTIQVQWTDPDTNGFYGSSFASPTVVSGSLIVMNGGETAFAGNPADIVLLPQVVYAKAGTAINFVYQDPGGTPNDFWSAVVERLG